MNINRNIRTTVRLSQDEYNTIKEKADNYRISVSTFMRNSSLEYHLNEPISDEMKNAYRKLVGMSNNVNQIAKKCHVDGAISMATEVLQTLDDLNWAIKKLKG
nr:plasmid mobilization relaxosome protein MobC [uncultured Carboxylicivirga sp.]